MAEETLAARFKLKTDERPQGTTGGDDDEGRKGRLYSPEHASQPGGIKVDEMIYGLKMAHLSCTDDTAERLDKAGENNTFEALKWIVGGDANEARRPLTELLKDYFGLTMDCWIDESGLKHGRAVDTQGFIASNEDTIVLSYRFTTSKMDWMTNLSMTTSEWEPDSDARIGYHAGHLSCLDGCFAKIAGNGKPRVHTGFYNNFMHTLPMVRKYIVEPLTRPGCPPKKVYICGCSLGAAIATMAFCYVVLKVPLESLEHKVLSVTAGCPRACDARMQQVIADRMMELRPLDRAVICRLVYNQDLVPHIPFNCLGFHHLDKLVYITTEGDVIVNPRLQMFEAFPELMSVINSFSNRPKVAEQQSKGEGESEKTKFQTECETTPVPIKDHMPYWYLTNLDNLKTRIESGGM
jgi:hypothetical protein